MQSSSKQGSLDEFAQRYFTKPTDESWWSQCKTMVYDKKSGSILGRTPFLWGRVLLFYMVFYAALAALFSGLMQILLLNLDDNQPHYILDESRIGTSPGLGYRPMAIKYKVDSSLIRYMARSRNNSAVWVNEIDEFLESYHHPEKLPGKGKNIQNCSHEEHLKPGNVCAVDMFGFEPCTHDRGYGFNESSPCIFIKINKIYGWLPEYYNDTEHLPEKMPESLKNKIRTSVTSDPKTINTVWVSCDGEGPADRENIGPISYLPRQGFPGYYYPYKNQPGYLSPLVAVRFEKPTPNVLINIECRAWARNIMYNHKNQLGSCHLELMVDQKLH